MGKTHRGRFKVRGVDYEKSFSSKKEAKHWVESHRPLVRKAPPEISFSRGVWTVCVKFNDSDFKQTFNDFSDAQTYLLKSKAEIEAGIYAPNSAESGNFGDFAQRWVAENGNIADKTKTDYRSLLRNHILPTLSEVPLRSISPKNCADWLAKMGRDGVGKTTQKRSVGLMKQIFETALDIEIINRNPASRLKVKEPHKAEKRFLDYGEVALLAKSTKFEFHILIWFLALTGLRINEALALKVGDVDLKKGLVNVKRAWIQTDGYKRKLGPTKSGRSRTVPLDKDFISAVQGQMVKKMQSDFLFTNSAGKPLEYAWFRKNVFNPAVAAAGLEGVSPHSLRHTYASLLLDKGAPIPVVSRLLGHASPATTMSIYAHAIRHADVQWVSDVTLEVTNEAKLLSPFQIVAPE